MLIKVCTFVRKVQHVEDEADAPDMRENRFCSSRCAPGRSVYCSYSEHDCSFSEQYIRYIGSFALPLLHNRNNLFFIFGTKSVFLSGLEGLARPT